MNVGSIISCYTRNKSIRKHSDGCNMARHSGLLLQKKLISLPIHSYQNCKPKYFLLLLPSLFSSHLPSLLPFLSMLYLYVFSHRNGEVLNTTIMLSSFTSVKIFGKAGNTWHKVFISIYFVNRIWRYRKGTQVKPQGM